MTEDHPSHKFHKALLGFAMAVSAVSGTVTFAEWEVQHVIKSTKEMIAEVKKPEVANGMTEKQWKELQEQQRAFYDLSQAQAFRDKLTQPQLKEIDYLSSQMPWYSTSLPNLLPNYYDAQHSGLFKSEHTMPHEPKFHQPPQTLNPPPPSTTTHEVTTHEVTTREVTTHETTTSSSSPTDPKPATKQVEPTSDDNSKDR